MTIEDEGVQQADGLLLDQLSRRLDSIALLRLHDGDAVDSRIESFGSRGAVEEQMLVELSNRRSIHHPERFDEAHRQAMRALEVFDRNGTKPPSSVHVPKLLKPLAKRLVQIFVQAIVATYQRRLVRSLRQLYALREAGSEFGGHEHAMLARARSQVDTIANDLNKATLPLPAFLVGGAAISGTISLINRSLTVGDWGRFCFSAAFTIIGFSLFWAILRAAGIARSRIRLALDASFLALWQVIGDAGRPPKDRAKLFAAVASILLLTIWIVVPGIVVWAILE